MNKFNSDKTEEKFSEEEILRQGINEKLMNMAESVVCSYIRCYCEKNGIENYETHSSYSGGSVTAFLDIGKNKCLSIMFLYISYTETISYLPILYDLSKKIINTPIKVCSKYLSNWRYSKHEERIRGNKIIQEYHEAIQNKLYSLGIECKIFEYKNYSRIKILTPAKICPIEVRISYNNFSYELSAFEDFLKNVIKFEEIPVNAYISQIPRSMRNKKV